MSSMLRRFLRALNGVSGISGLILSQEATDVNFFRQLRWGKKNSSHGKKRLHSFFSEHSYENVF